MLRFATLFGLAIVFCCLGAGESPADERPEIQLVHWRGPQLCRIDLRLELDGRRLSEVWDEQIAELARFYDRDGGGLSQAEASRLPSIAAIREVMGLGFIPQLGKGPTWEQLDSNMDGVASADEVAVCYRTAGLDMPQIAVGVMPFSRTLTQAIVQQFDADSDARVTLRELQAADELTAKLDQNSDELVGAGELVGRILYPGIAGGVLLLPTCKTSGATQVASPNGSLLLLPSDWKDDAWALQLIENRDRYNAQQMNGSELGLNKEVLRSLDDDGNGAITAHELLKWRSLPPSQAYTVRLLSDSDSSLEISSPKEPASQSSAVAQVVLRTDLGRLAEASRRVSEHFQGRFEKADKDENRIVSPDETMDDGADWRWLIPTADRDQDGSLSRAEVDAWLELQKSVASCQIMFTVLDGDNGLFELLDTSHDGALSVRELREAAGRLQSVGCVPGGTLNIQDLPRTILLTASRGYPQSPLGREQRTGPNWFLAMDRNEDGLLSKAEFSGPTTTFSKLDSDQDGYLSVTELPEAR